MKRILSVVLCFIIFLLGNINAFGGNTSVTIDGNRKNSEWKDSQNVEVDGSMGNDVKNALCNALVDNDKNTVYLCFSFETDIDQYGSPDIGVIFNAPDCDEFTISIADAEPTTDYDEDWNEIPDYTGVVATNELKGSDYVITSALCLYSGGTAICELALRYINGIPENLTVSVNFLDNDGDKSNIKKITVKNIEETTTYAVTAATESTAKEKTTKEKTTKAKTTKATTTKKVTTTKVTTTKKQKTTTEESVTEKTHRVDAVKTTAAATTVRSKKSDKTTTEKSTTVKTTKEKTTKEKTTKAGTTKAEKTEKESSAAVDSTTAYVEKVIISEVYVTEEETETTSGGSLFNLNSANKSNLYKWLIGAAALIMITAISVLAVRNPGKKEDGEEDK